MLTFSTKGSLYTYDHKFFNFTFSTKGNMFVSFFFFDQIYHVVEPGQHGKFAGCTVLVST